MKNLRIFKYLIAGLMIAIGSYAFGAVSLKVGLFPFGKGFTPYFRSFVAYTKNFMFDLEIVEEPTKTYSEEYFSTLVDFEINWTRTQNMESYGAIVPLSKLEVLHVTQAGEVLIKNLAQQTTEKPEIPNVPINKSSFDDYAASISLGWNADNFGVKDAILVSSESLGDLLVVSTNTFLRANQCVDLKVFYMELRRESKNWVESFRSEPCIEKMEGMMAWGAGLAEIDEHTLLLTVGDVDHNGSKPEYEDLVSDQLTDYGKTHLIDLKKKTTRLFSRGHRNSQGIIKSKKGLLLAVEHGPTGGDELNIIIDGNHYGWPYDTFGVDHGIKNWPFNKRNGYHDHYVQPLISWAPSIAPSDITEVTSNGTLWSGDILISGLRSESIFRLKINNDKVIFMERIEIGRRLRKIASFQNRIFLKDQVSGEIGYFDVPLN